MRALFFGFCIVLGVLAGSWWAITTSTHSSSSQEAAPEQSDLISQPLQISASTRAQDTNSTATDTYQGVEPAPRASSQLSGNAAADSTRFSYHEGIMRVAPSVASVYTDDTQGEVTGAGSDQGSGVIVDPDGVVLTNLHLVAGRKNITVVLSDGRNFAGRLIGSDKETDLAVIRIPATGLPFMRLDEAPPAKVGDIVLAIGNPFGVGQTVTQGIVSATRRRVANGSVWQNFIQTDAAINPGNSGGALINPLGQLVGVNTAVIRADVDAVGIGFSIPAELLAQVVPQIIENGSVARGWLGVDVEELSMFPFISSIVSQGVVITGVLADGPAELAGVTPGDIVTTLGEQQINNATQFLLAVSSLPPNATVKIELLRDPDLQSFRESGKQTRFTRLQFKIRLGERPTINPLQPAQ